MITQPVLTQVLLLMRVGNATLFIGNSVTSTYENVVESYRGIKYATLKRFAPSEILLADGVIDAIKYGDACPQRPTITFHNGSFSEIEDCLYLNIWKPNSENDDVLLPVMVYIHGGNFVVGHGGLPNKQELKTLLWLPWIID